VILSRGCLTIAASYNYYSIDTYQKNQMELIWIPYVFVLRRIIFASSRGNSRTRVIERDKPATDKRWNFRAALCRETIDLGSPWKASTQLRHGFFLELAMPKIIACTFDETRGRYREIPKARRITLGISSRTMARVESWQMTLRRCTRKRNPMSDRFESMCIRNSHRVRSEHAWTFRIRRSNWEDGIPAKLRDVMWSRAHIIPTKLAWFTHQTIVFKKPTVSRDYKWLL